MNVGWYCPACGGTHGPHVNTCPNPMPGTSGATLRLTNNTLPLCPCTDFCRRQSLKHDSETMGPSMNCQLLGTPIA